MFPPGPRGDAEESRRWSAHQRRKTYLHSYLEERCQKGNEASRKRRENQNVGENAFTVNMLCENTASWNKEHFRRADTRNTSRFKGHPWGRERGVHESFSSGVKVLTAALDNSRPRDSVYGCADLQTTTSWKTLSNFSWNPDRKLGGRHVAEELTAPWNLSVIKRLILFALKKTWTWCFSTFDYS